MSIEPGEGRQAAASPTREHFIPIRKADLVELLCREPGLAGERQQEFRRLCRMLEAVFHFEYHQRLEALKDAYAAFDPDADTRPLRPVAAEQKKARLDALFHEFVWLLERANFRRLGQEHLLEALQSSSDWGLSFQIDFSRFERLELFARGEAVVKRLRRRWRRLLRKEEVMVPVYQRLVVMLRFRPHERNGLPVDSDSVFVKIFKDIPKMDLEMLLPGTRPRMRMTDRLKITLPTMTGVGMAGWKVATGFATLLAGNTLALLGIAGGTLGYGVRSFVGYQQTKQKYQLTLTESLYFQNLDNNAGVLFRLLDEAEEQECREALLAYYFLWQCAGPDGWSREELDRAIEQYLARAAGVRIDFEIGDALEKLQRLRLVERSPQDRLRAPPIEQALEGLDRVWDDYFPYSRTS